MPDTEERIARQQIAVRTLERGVKYPYAEGFQPQDAADRAALGICADLCDRRGIKWAMEDVDENVRRDIVEAIAEIVRAAASISKEEERHG